MTRPPVRPPPRLRCTQVLLSQVHRLRALVLLGRFLDMGAWAVDLALSGAPAEEANHRGETDTPWDWCSASGG